MKRILHLLGIWTVALGLLPAMNGPSSSVPAAPYADAQAVWECLTTSHADEHGSDDVAVPNFHKPRSVHHTTARNHGGGASAPVSVQTVAFGLTSPLIAEERTKPFVRWIHNHTAVLANPPPSFE